MFVSVIIPVYNRQDFIKACIDSVLNQKFEDYEIIVIDDASSDGTGKVLQQIKDPKLTIVTNDKNHGPAFSRNRGIEVSKGGVIAFTDSDCTAQEDWLAEITAPFIKDSHIMITAGQIIEPKSNHYWQVVNQGSCYIAQKEGYVASAFGGNMACRKEFISHRKFDEYLSASEDYALCIACLKKKHKIYYSPSARVTHHHRRDAQTTILRQWQYGLWNTYARCINNSPPYINVGSWLLLGIGLCLLLYLRGNSNFLIGLIVLVLLYGLLVFYVGRFQRRQSTRQTIKAYFGLLLSCLANCMGSLYGVIALPVMKGKKHT